MIDQPTLGGETEKLWVWSRCAVDETVSSTWHWGCRGWAASGSWRESCMLFHVPLLSLRLTLGHAQVFGSTGWCHPTPSRSWAAQSSRRSGLWFAALWSCSVTSPSDEGTARAALRAWRGHSRSGRCRATSCHHRLLWTQGWGWPGQPRLLQCMRARASVDQGRGSKCNLARSFSRGRWRTRFFYSPNSTFLLRRINSITKSWSQRSRKSRTRQASLGKCSGHADPLRVLFMWRILPA